MWVHGSLQQEGKRLPAFMSALILILGDLLGQWVIGVGAMSVSEKVVAPGMCPTIHRYIPRDSRAFIPMTPTTGSSILCRVNTSSFYCDWILIANRGRIYYFDKAMKEQLVLYNMGLIVLRMRKELEGEYQVLLGVNRTCEVRVLITAVGPLFLYRILLLIPGIMFLCGLGLLWDWLIKTRNRLATSWEQQRATENIQQVVLPSEWIP
ncbi:hypothetical protein lerEdw1_011420 [Lerista edwardsae]|nr:hypothetical protein lerEdw1_011420 [Lerista edwardsae]